MGGKSGYGRIIPKGARTYNSIVEKMLTFLNESFSDNELFLLLF